MRRTGTICVIDGCGKPRHARGSLCSMHRSRRQRDGDMYAPPKQALFGCSVAGCERPHKTNGFCSKHYQRYRKHGDPNVVIKEHLHRSERRGGVYSSWTSMKARCNNPAAINYPLYGGKGIGYDPRWERFSAFFDDMGDRPRRWALHRIDSGRDYSKANCVWMDPAEHARLHNRKRVRT